MSIYKADSIELSDEDDAAFANYQITLDQLVSVVEHFGYTNKEAYDLVAHSHARAICELVRCKLFLLFRAGDLLALPDVLENVEMQVVPIDDCQLIYIGEPTTQLLSKKQINELRKTLGPLYPDHIKSFKFEMMGPDGPVLSLRSFDWLAYEELSGVLTYYQKWLDKQKEKITPLFEQVREEIGDWLQNKLNGIKPRSVGFIAWFLANRMSQVLGMEMNFPADPETRQVTIDDKTVVTVTLNWSFDEPALDTIEQDMIEYGLWKQAQIEQVFSKLSSVEPPMIRIQADDVDCVPAPKQPLPDSLIPEKPTESPTCDVKRLQTDYKYAYDKINELTAYMATIEPYTERVLYFMRVSQDIGLGLSMFNMASRIIPERESQYNGRVHLDEAGNTVDVKSWGLSYSNETEHITLKKLWFLAVRHEEYSAFGRYKNIPLEQRKADYFASLPTISVERYNRKQLKQIKADIKELHEEYNKFQDRKTGDDKWEPEPIKRQRLNAPALIEHELMGIKAIDWLAFHHSKYLQLFGILWDIVAFKLFLLNLSPSTDEPTDNVPESVTPDNVAEYITTDNVPEAVTTDKDKEDTESKQDTFRPFPDLLAGSFTNKELDRLLIHVRMKDAAGKNIWPQKFKSAIWGVIKALDTKNHLIKTTGTEYSRSLSAYMDLGSTRVKHGHSTIEDDIKKKALSFLNQPVTGNK